VSEEAKQNAGATHVEYELGDVPLKGVSRARAAAQGDAGLSRWYGVGDNQSAFGRPIAFLTRS
jgi:hypothetical protein